MLRNEARYRSQLTYTIATQTVLTDAGGPVGAREFAIRLHHKDRGEMRQVLSAFDGFADEALDHVRQAERGWWASGFDVLVLQVLHAAAVSGSVVVTGRIAGRPDTLVVIDPVQLSSGRLDVDKGSLTVDEGGVIEVFTRLCVAAPAKTPSADEASVATPGDTKPAAKLPLPTTGRPRPRRDKVVEMAEALHAVLWQYPDHAVPMKVVGKQGERRAVSSTYEGCHFLHMKMKQLDVWGLLSPETQGLFVSEDSFRREVAGPGGEAREGYLVTLDDQDVLEALRAGFRKKIVGPQGKGEMHVGGGVKGDKNGGKPLFPRLYWLDKRDGRKKD